MRIPILALTFLSWGPNVAISNAAEMIPNGSFDSDISGWNLPTTPDTTVSWDSDGLPDGSLRIDTSWANTGVIDVESACFLVESGETYFRSGDARASDGSVVRCGIDIQLYSDVACTSPTGSTNSGSNGTGVWERIEGDHSTGFAFRLVLRLHRNVAPTAAPATCWFDNVSLIGPNPSPLAVSALDRPGLLALALAIGGAALMALRRG
jgi:hypothetical protein